MSNRAIIASFVLCVLTLVCLNYGKEIVAAIFIAAQSVILGLSEDRHP